MKDEDFLVLGTRPTEVKDLGGYKTARCLYCGCKMSKARTKAWRHYGLMESCTRIRQLRAKLLRIRSMFY